MIRELSTLTRADVSQVGAKAAHLGELLAAGLSVPPGFVIDVRDYQAATARLTWPLADDEIDAAFAALPLSPELETAFHSAFTALVASADGADFAVAVRSSAPGEDGAGASFAGQHRTYLNVRSAKEAAIALRACWAGAWRAEVGAYRAALAARGQHLPPPAMAVVVQRLLLPDVAGVMFTADPVTGERDRLVVDAAWGLGEAVVSGWTAPDRVVVDKHEGRVISYAVGEKAIAIIPGERGTMSVEVEAARRAAQSLDAAAIATLHATALRIENHFGPNQDVEFAWLADTRELFILQARPITAIPPPPPPGGWKPPTEAAPGEKHPGWERRNFAEHVTRPLSPLAETLVLPSVSFAMQRLAHSMGLTLPSPPLATVHGWTYARDDQTLRLSALWRFPWVYGRLFLKNPATWAWAGDPAARLATWKANAPHKNAGTTALAAWLEQGVGLLADTWADVHRLSGGWRWSEYALRRVLADPAWAAALLPGGAGAGERLELALEAIRKRGDGPDVATAYDERLAYMARLGATLPDSLDPAFPAPLGSVAAIASLLEQPSPNPAGRRISLLARRDEAKARLADLPLARRLLAWVLLPWAQRFAAVREPALDTLGLPFPALRAGFERLGRALVEQEQLATADDVYWLPWQQIRDLPPSVSRESLEAEAKAARALHATRSDYAPPLRLGLPPDNLPAKAIVGIAASPGQARGPVRIVSGPDDFAAFQAGEILVAATTTPAWTPLFGRAGAIVTDVGGPLSHGSIVARELGIPAVLGTESATRRLKTGMHVLVDGTTGVIWPQH